MFKNRTTRFELDVKLTQKVIDELVSRGKVEITGDVQSADAILIGEILSFAASPIFSNPYFVYQEEYEVPEGADFETVETEAIDKVAEKFARSLVITVLEGF